MIVFYNVIVTQLSTYSTLLTLCTLFYLGFTQHSFGAEIDVPAKTKQTFSSHKCLFDMRIEPTTLRATEGRLLLTHRVSILKTIFQLLVFYYLTITLAKFPLILIVNK